MGRHLTADKTMRLCTTIMFVFMSASITNFAWAQSTPAIGGTTKGCSGIQEYDAADSSVRISNAEADSEMSPTWNEEKSAAEFKAVTGVSTGGFIEWKIEKCAEDGETPKLVALQFNYAYSSSGGKPTSFKLEINGIHHETVEFENKADEDNLASERRHDPDLKFIMSQRYYVQVLRPMEQTRVRLSLVEGYPTAIFIQHMQVERLSIDQMTEDMDLQSVRIKRLTKEKKTQSDRIFELEGETKEMRDDLELKTKTILEKTKIIEEFGPTITAVREDTIKVEKKLADKQAEYVAFQETVNSDHMKARLEVEAVKKTHDEEMKQCKAQTHYWHVEADTRATFTESVITALEVDGEGTPATKLLALANSKRHEKWAVQAKLTASEKQVQDLIKGKNALNEKVAEQKQQEEKLRGDLVTCHQDAEEDLNTCHQDAAKVLDMCHVTLQDSEAQNTIMECSLKHFNIYYAHEKVIQNGKKKMSVHFAVLEEKKDTCHPYRQCDAEKACRLREYEKLELGEGVQSYFEEDLKTCNDGLIEQDKLEICEGPLDCLVKSYSKALNTQETTWGDDIEKIENNCKVLMNA